MLQSLIQQLGEGVSLTPEQVVLAVGQLVEEQVPVTEKATFLAALAAKGETVEEIAAFATELRAKSITPPLDEETRAREILDVCGTGGDRLNTFNISTTVAILCAAAGITVAKHGNRAVTSQAGSADVLEALGVRVDLPPEEAARSLRERKFAFFFAPHYHPVFKHLSAARKVCAERGQRTVFNILGPLLNPARPTAQLVGVPRPALCEPMARVLQSLGVRRGMVVAGRVALAQPPLGARINAQIPSEQLRVIGLHGEMMGVMTKARAISLAKSRQLDIIEVGADAVPPICRMMNYSNYLKAAKGVSSEPTHLDELSTLGPNTIAEFYQDRGFSVTEMEVEHFPLQPATLSHLAGADKRANAEIVRRILHGKERGPKRDAVLLNAAAALFVAGKVKALMDGWELASELLDNGTAEHKLAELAG
ncbi:MAG TPA: anthranilate phosphoribosyltransferase [Verrucomicrobiae bacterium]|nr:anthranilate phosphoribosyltransferase [Verrucomicrobiae bacterium]